MACTNLTNSIQVSNEAEKDHGWIVEIRDTLLDLENRHDVPACIFRVPNLEADVKPEAYMPRIIALGPYHHFKPELYEFEHEKLEAVKRSFKPSFDIHQFDTLVKKLETREPDISKFYRDVPVCCEIFACIMAIDGVFLLDLIRTVSDKEKLGYQKSQPEIYAILKDVLKLENQIPLVVLKLFLEINSSCTMDDFHRMLQKFCQEVSPLELDWCSIISPHWDMVSEPLHLLDLLYHGITFKEKKEEASPASTNHPCSSRSLYSIDSKQMDTGACSKLLNHLSNLKVGGFMKNLLKVISKLLGLIPLPSTSFFKEKKVLIPSVSKLCRAGFKFCPTNGGTGTVKFDEKTNTFHLPVITLKRTSEVVIRNLVVYETMAKSKTKSLNFRRYTELMSAMVDTIEDVHLLKDSQVLIVVQEEDSKVPENDQNQKAEACLGGCANILSSCCPCMFDHNQCHHVGGVLSDAEIVEMFNGINKTMESKDEVIDQAIKKANKCYSETHKVKAYRLMKKYVYSSWKILIIFASVLLLLLTALQAVCDIYSCPSIFHTAKKI